VTLDDEAMRGARPALDAASLLALDDRAFVVCVYLTLLRRAPDDEGLLHYLRKLRAGSTKLEIVALIAHSKEGRAKATRLPGLDRALTRYRWSRVPVVGALLRWVIGADGYSARDRRLRAIEQSLARQEASTERLFVTLEVHLAGLRSDIAAGRSQFEETAGEDGAGELLLQPRGQTPSVISRVVSLAPGTAEGVMAQLGDLVASSLEAERLAVARRSRARSIESV